MSQFLKSSNYEVFEKSWNASIFHNLYNPGKRVMNVVGLLFATCNMNLVRPYFILLYNQMAGEMKEWVRPPDLMRSCSHNIKYLLKRGQNTLQSSHHS